MNFLGREIGGGVLFYEKSVVSLAVGKRPDAGFGAALRDILITDERGEAGVSGQDGIPNSGKAGMTQALLIGLGDAPGEREKGLGEGRLSRLLGGEGVALIYDFLQQETGLHQFIGYAFAHLDHGLLQKNRNLFEARNIVLVVFDRLKGEQVDKLGQINLDAVLLVHRHFPVFEASALYLHLEVTNHQSFVERLLLGEARSIGSVEASEEFPSLLQILVDGFLREVVEFVVPALVSQVGSEERTGAQPVFPLLGQKIVERLAP